MEKNASAGNRTRVDSLEGYNSTTKPPMLGYLFLSLLHKIIIFLHTTYTTSKKYTNISGFSKDSRDLRI